MLCLWALWSTWAAVHPCGPCTILQGTLPRRQGPGWKVVSAALATHPPCPEPNLQHSMGLDAVCKETILPLASGSAPGTPASHACSSSQCPSRLSAAQCPRSSASGSPRSRCCRRRENPLTTDHLRELEVTHSGRLQYTDKLFSQELRPQWGVRHKAIKETPRGKLLL